MALEASEYARDRGAYDRFHGLVFHAYLTDTRDIGDLDVLQELAEQSDLDADEMTAALSEGRYSERIDQAMNESRRLGITAVPTFIVNGEHFIVGAQSLDFFRQRLRSIETEHSQ
jgi:predicted DsbA family dithiol-disulfide isomerase